MIKKLFTGLALGVVLAGSAGAQIIAQWNFENLTLPTTSPANTGTTLPAPTAGTYSADIGSGTFSALHASASSTWTVPPGNGTAKGINVNNWAVGDYFQFEISTIGFTNIYLAWSQRGSNTGPRDFKLQYSLDGSLFVDYTNYTTANNAWSATSYSAPSTKYYDLSSVSSLNGDSSVYFRLVSNSTTSINGATVAGTGTGAIDQFTISQGFVDITVTPVPEPHEYALLVTGLLGVVVLMRRRKAAQVF